MLDEMWVYLDANIVRDLETALDPTWRPPPDLCARVTRDWRSGRTDVQFMAAGRFYWHSRKRSARGPALWPVVSSTVRGELARRPNGDITLGVFFDMDQSRNALPRDVIDPLADQIVATIHRDPEDARHLARVLPAPYIGCLVTNDDKLRGVATRRGHSELRVTDIFGAVDMLGIPDGEQPPTILTSSSLRSAIEPWLAPRVDDPIATYQRARRG